ncbi:glycosyltransferase family 2 protein [Flavobacterium sp. LB2R40]|uniref:glycosyltransferase family 2 protein n=1 Tax=Flavobacterium sp. LB2R40 TaxID=3401722 RepID=UPI003AAB6EA6
MEITQSAFTLLITTKNRIKDLIFTLDKIKYLLEKENVKCIICDDGSTDGTSVFIQTNYPEMELIQNRISKGLIFSRNRLLSLVKTEFAISLDDDAHFITKNPLHSIQEHFKRNTNCGLIAFRIFWGLDEPNEIFSTNKTMRVQGFVGCAHVWRMKAWEDIPNYPDWFVFYGEEDFAAYQLFKNNWGIDYLPEVLVNHRVNIKARKNNKDYTQRLRMSLRSGWYLFSMFYPLRKIPKKIMYSIAVQMRDKVFKGDLKVLKALFLAGLDLVMAIPKIIKNKNRLTNEEYDLFQKLPATKIYWQPNNNKN